MTDSHAGTDTSDFASTDLVIINGVVASYGASLGALVSNINTDTTSHGLKAEQKGNNLILSGANVAGVTIEVKSSLGAAASTGTNATTS